MTLPLFIKIQQNPKLPQIYLKRHILISHKTYIYSYKQETGRPHDDKNQFAFRQNTNGKCKLLLR